MSVKSIPEDYNNLTVYLNIKNAEAAIDYYKKVFGATEIGRLMMPDQTIGHAELQIGDSKIMLSEENAEWGNLSPQSIGGTAVSLALYVEDVDSIFNKALEAGGKAQGGMEVKDQFYGDRTGTFTDPYGHRWTIATHIEDVSFEEMQKRSDKMFAAQQ
jgi:PhnB protein